MKFNFTAKHMNYLIITFTVIAFLIIFVNTSKYGSGCWPDCVHYISTARNLLSGTGYYAYSNIPYVEFPPLFPTLLAIIGLVGIDPFIAARYVNALFFSLIVLISSLWLKRHIESRTLQIFGALAILFSIPLIEICVTAMSEPLFIVLTLLFIWEMELFLVSNKDLSFFLAILFATLACLTRYIGVTLVVTGLALLLIKRDISLTKKILKGLLLITACALPVSSWVLRNYLVTSTLTGTRKPSSYNFGQIIYYTLDTATSWFMPPLALTETQIFSKLPLKAQGLLHFVTFSPVARFIISIFFLCIIISSFLFFIWRIRNRRKNESLLAVTPVFLFLIFYLGILVIIIKLIHVDNFQPVDNRFLSPAYSPIVLLIIYMIDQLLQFSRRTFSKPSIRVILIAITIVMTIYPFVYSGVMSIKFINNGAGGYSQIEYRNSPTILYLKNNPLKGNIISNSPDRIYLLTGLSANFSPKTYEDITSLQDILTNKKNNIYLVWFEDGWESAIKIQELDSKIELKTIKTFPDGTIYLLR